MGIRYKQHDSMCGCSRCACEWERENPQPIFDEIQDPDYRDDEEDHGAWAFHDYHDEGDL